jgi:RNA polymerase sigma-70 factor (ECF subfamily)
VLLSDLLTQTAMTSTPRDETDLGRLRADLFGRLRASGWGPSLIGRGERLAPVVDLLPKPAEQPQPASDAALLERFLQDDPLAFNLLFDRHAARLNGYARRWLRGADAEDAVQGTFLVLFEKAKEILDREAPDVAAFLFAALRYKILRALAARETPVPEPGADETSPTDDGLTALLRREEAGRLARLLERTCNPLEQHVMMLDLEDRSDAEIVSALQITPVHARVARHRAIAKLRRALQEDAS